MKPQRLGGTLTMAMNAVAALNKYSPAKPYRIKPDDKSDMYKVYFTLKELYRYAIFCCRQVGLTLNNDGSLTTHDGRTVTLEDSH